MPADSTITANTPTPAPAPDTVADAAATVRAPLLPRDSSVMTIDQAPVAIGAERPTFTGVPPFMHGLRPRPRALLPGYDSNVMLLLVIVFLILSANFRNYGSFLKNYVETLWKERRRADSYTTHTIGETGTLLSLIFLTVVNEGIIAFSLMARNGADISSANLFSTLAMVIGVAALYYAAQAVAYTVVGRTFATGEITAQWLKGFNASQTLLGIILTVPAMIVLFNPGTARLMAAISFSLYIIARIVFISKGFRLFYNKIGSLLYFILYLCALEIIPIVMACRAI